MNSKELFAKADAMSKELEALRKQACEAHRQELLSQALADRMELPFAFYGSKQEGQRRGRSEEGVR